jgi:ABC-type branched-subunit amino acid transport system substrate-binding protein
VLPRRLGIRAGAAAAALALAACGSTVQGARSPEALGRGPGEDLATGRGGSDSLGGPGGAGSQSGSGALPGGTARSTAATSTGRTSANRSTTAGTLPKGDLLIGAYGALIGVKEADVGITGIALGDQEKQFDAVASWINANGGMAGHKIKLVVAIQDVTGNRTTQDQAACEKFTDDNHVVAAVSLASSTETFYGCMANKGLVHIANTSTASSAANFAKYRSLLFATAPTQDRVAVTLADELARAGYFKDPAMKLGIFRFDHPWWADAAKAFRARAATYGVKVAEELTACQGCNDSPAQHQAAVLRFNTMNVNHLVMFGDANLTLQFMIEAGAQGYRPRYGLSTYNAPQLLATNQGANLQRAVGVGFEPSLDVNKAEEPPPSPPDALCRKIMADAGEPAEDSRFELAQAVHTCEGLFLLKTVLDRVGSVRPDTFLPGLESLGTSYQPALTFATRFGVGRHDGASQYRPLAFDSSCACFRYAGGPIAMAE